MFKNEMTDIIIDVLSNLLQDDPTACEKLMKTNVKLSKQAGAKYGIKPSKFKKYELSVFDLLNMVLAKGKDQEEFFYVLHRSVGEHDKLVGFETPAGYEKKLGRKLNKSDEEQGAKEVDQQQILRRIYYGC